MKTCHVYYKALNKALSNGRDYHVAAILKRSGKVIRIGENTSKTHPRFRKCDHVWTMAKPCPYCVKHMIQQGISKVRYTNWRGEWEELYL